MPLSQKIVISKQYFSNHNQNMFLSRLNQKAAKKNKKTQQKQLKFT